MFDDPKKELRRLDEELRAAESPPEPEETDDFSLEDILGGEPEEEDWLRDAKILLGEEPPTPEAPRIRQQPRNDAVNFHRTVYADEPSHENTAVFVEKQKRRGNGCLPIVLLLELAGIAGLIWWWYRWLG